MTLSFGEISWDTLLLLDSIPKPGCQAFVGEEVSIPGGCALNTAVHLAAMSGDVVLGGNDVGGDIYGDRIRESLTRFDVRFIAKQIKSKKTPRCDCLIDNKTKERSFLLWHDGIQQFRPDMFNEISLGNIDLAFVDPYLKEASSALLELIQKRCNKIWLQDLGPDDPRVALGDVVQISLDESEDLGEKKLRLLGQRYFRGRCSTLIATAGKNGVFLFRSDGLFIFREAQRAEVVDTTGCGDAFRAGAMVAWKKGRSWDEILQAGVERGAYQATLFGSNPLLVLTKL